MLPTHHGSCPQNVCVYDAQSFRNLKAFAIIHHLSIAMPVCVCVYVCVPRDHFHHAQTARFNIPTFLPCCTTISPMSMWALQRPLAH